MYGKASSRFKIRPREATNLLRNLRKIINSTVGMPIHRWVNTNKGALYFPPTSNARVNRESGASQFSAA